MLLIVKMGNFGLSLRFEFGLFKAIFDMRNIGQWKIRGPGDQHFGFVSYENAFSYESS